MNYTYLHYQIALTRLRGIGPKLARELLSQLEDISDIFLLSDASLARTSTFSKLRISNMRRDEALKESASIAEYVHRYSISTHFFTDADFPERLKACDDAPLLLYTRGNIALNGKHFVAVVGTRAMTDYGKHCCHSLMEALQDCPVTIVSGLALGVDAYAHSLALEFRLPTIGVLGHGLDRIYPHSHKKLAKSMEECGGLLTEFVPGTTPDRENFPKRNRIVAGMCDATIVIESKERGGSLITADLAFQYDREVFAFPGNAGQQNSLGCNQLIRSQKAQLITSGADFIESMGWSHHETKTSNVKTTLPPLTATQHLLMRWIKQTPTHIDYLIQQTQLPTSEVHSELFFLELAGRVRSIPGKLYMALD